MSLNDGGTSGLGLWQMMRFRALRSLRQEGHSVVGKSEQDRIITANGVVLEIMDHKAQGSQFRRVGIPVFPSRFLDWWPLIYTALTRATEHVVLVGDRGALEAAVAAPPAPHRRHTGMGGAQGEACL